MLAILQHTIPAINSSKQMKIARPQFWEMHLKWNPLWSTSTSSDQIYASLTSRIVMEYSRQHVTTKILLHLHTRQIESQHYPPLSCIFARQYFLYFCSTVFLVNLLDSISCKFALQYFLYFCSTVFLPTFLLCLSCLLFWMLLPLPVWEGWWNEPHHNQRIIF